MTRVRGAALPRVAAVFALAAVAPLFFSAGGNVLHNMVLAAAYVVMALGLNIIVGFAGLLDLGYDYIAIVTLAFGEIVGKIVSNGRSIELLGGTLTSGPIGIGPIDRIELPLIGRFGAVDLRPWYWFALALVALALVVNVNLRGSRIGRACIAMRHDESAAAAAGIPIVRTKLLAYGTGAAFGGISGAFLASYLGVVNAVEFEFSFSIFILAMVVLGGVGSIPGVVAGAIILSVVNSYLLPDVLFDLPRNVGLAFDLSAISSGIYGAILLVVMLLRPHGLVPAWRTVEQKAKLRAKTRGGADRRRSVQGST